MNKTLSSKQKSKLLSSIYQTKQLHNNHQFVRSYSQLVNRHFTQSLKEKSSLRRTISSSQGFRTKKNMKLAKFTQDSPQELNLVNKNTKTKATPGQCFNFITSNFRLDKSLVQNSIDPQINNSRHQQTKFQLNPQTNQKIEQILMSKTQMIEKNSHQNVLLNQKLHQSTNQKKSLMTLMQSLKMEILKQKKMKAKISTNMGKLMNKIQQANTSTRKTQQQRFYIKQQTKLLQKEHYLQQRKNQQLYAMSEMNKEKISIQKELISDLTRNIQQTKMQYFQMRNYLNEIKQIYMRENKCLLKMEMNYSQSTQERNLFCKTVQRSVTNVKEKPKH